LSTSADNSGSLQLATNNGTTAVTIDTSQNVGIGTASPNGLLSVYGTGRLATFRNAITGSGSSDGSYVSLNGNDLQIANGESANMIFYTADTERMRIGSSGRIFLGCTSEPNASVNGFSADTSYTIIAGYDQIPFYVNRNNTSGIIQQLRFDNNNVGNISTNGSNCTFNSTSDYRLKENITPMTGALAKVQALNPVTYTWKKDGQTGEGFVAHELAEVCPEAVTGSKDAVELVDVKDEEGNVIGQEEKPVYQAIDQSVLVATLTAAIQELNAKVEAQAVRIAELEGEK
jgi:hypothetical protein